MPTHRIPSRSSCARALSAAALLACTAVQAQTPACEQFKAELTARISRNPGSFRIDALPSGAPVPAGGRVVGNCSGGQWKLVLLTGAAAAATPTTASAPASAAAPAPARTPAPAADPPVPKTAAAAPPATPPQRPLPTSAPPRPVASAPPVAPAPVPLPAPTPAAEPSAAPADAPASSTTSAGWPLRNGPLLWIAGALAVLVAIGVWRWIAYRMHYDAAGLPRGPRLD